MKILSNCVSYFKMLPEAFRKRIKQQQYIDSEGLIRALEETSPVTIRINRDKWNRYPLKSEHVAWCRDGFYIDERPSFTLDPLFHAGCYYPQEAAGMFLEEIFKQITVNKNNIKVLDLCGAPGGKSTHLSTLIGSEGLLVANEVIKERAITLAENLTKWGLSNAIVTQNDPLAFSRLPGFFDLVLVDAPCSGEGMFRNMSVINEWSEENSRLCSERQKRILMDVWPSLKENGILVYSTCTFNPGENEEIIKWVTGKCQSESLELDISAYENLTKIHYGGIYGYGFFPGRIRSEGLFISVLRKTRREPGISLKIKKGNGQRLTQEEKRIVTEWTRFTDNNIIRTGNEIIVPAGRFEDFLTVLRILKITKAGTRICSVKAGKYLPSHEIAMSVFYRKESFPVVNLNLDQALTYLSRGHLILDNAQRGWNIVCYNGVNLGFINNIGSRLNNYYPVNWRIRIKCSEQGKENILRWK